MKLDLKPIVKIDVNLENMPAARKGFNVALLLGPNTVIKSEERVRTYTSAEAMIEDGFKSNDPEYKAAQLYFSQHPAPDKVIIGCKGAEEAWLDAASACRGANSEWYILVPLGAGEDDIKTLAGWVESTTPDTVMFYTTAAEGAVGDSDEASIFAALKAKSYRRSMGYYTSSEDPVAAAWAGVACGLNSGVSGSAFDMAYKSAVGITTDALTETQVERVAGSRTTTGTNGNVYVTRAEEYKLLHQGRMADGIPFDEVLNLDMLKNNILLNIMDLMANSRKVPQIDGGIVMITNAINTACETGVKTGFIAPGEWTGPRVLTLEHGDLLPAGYLVLSEPLNEQPKADRERRISPPLYVCIKLAGAIEFVIVNLNVNR